MNLKQTIDSTFLNESVVIMKADIQTMVWQTLNMNSDESEQPVNHLTTRRTA